MARDVSKSSPARAAHSTCGVARPYNEHEARVTSSSTNTLAARLCINDARKWIKAGGMLALRRGTNKGEGSSGRIALSLRRGSQIKHPELRRKEFGLRLGIGFGI